METRCLPLRHHDSRVSLINMFKFDRVNSSMLCMIRGKLCITIATAFTVTMATHLFLFMLFVDQQLINGVSQYQGKSGGFPVEIPTRLKNTVKRDLYHQPKDISGELPQINEKVGLDKNNSILIKTMPGAESDMKIARKILGKNFVENTREVHQGWLSQTFQAIKRRLSDIRETSVAGKTAVPHKTAASSIHAQINKNGDIHSSKYSDKSSLDMDTGVKMSGKSALNSFEPGEHVLGVERASIEEEIHGKNSKADTGSVMFHPRNIKEVIVQEINIPPTREDDEWEPQDDWNMDHLIVAETKKKSPPNTKKTPKVPDSKKPLGKTPQKHGSRDVDAGTNGVNTMQDTLNMNKEKYRENSINQNALKEQHKVNKQPVASPSKPRDQSGTILIKNKGQRPTEPLKKGFNSQGSRIDRQYDGSPKTIVGTLVKSNNKKSISVVPKLIDNRVMNAGRVATSYHNNNQRDPSDFQIDSLQNNLNQIYRQGFNVPLSDNNHHPINSNIKPRNSLRDSVPVVNNIQGGRRTSRLTPQDIQHLHDEYVQRKPQQ